MLVNQKIKIRFVSKKNPADKNVWSGTTYQLYKNIESIDNVEILLLPTKVECAGIVFCEASAYGLPIFTCDTGGVANYVVDGKNGYRLNVSVTGKDFAEKIKKILDNNELSSLSLNCRNLYDEKLNWNVWKSKFIKILKELN